MSNTTPSRIKDDQHGIEPQAAQPARWTLPAWQRWPVELVRLFQAYGPGWMLAAVFLCTLPWMCVGGAVLLTSITNFVKAVG